MHALKALVQSSQNLKVLNFPNNELDQDCGGILAKIIEMNSNLEELNFSYNKLSNNG